MFKNFLVLLFLCSSLAAQAKPKSLEVWFLSVNRSAWLDTIINKPLLYKRTAQAKLQCQPMGEFCFDPQVGLYKRGEEKKMQEAVDYAEVEKNESYDFIDPAKSVEREMIECEKSNFFDIFCGKAQKKMKAGKSPLEVWIDVSSTMKQVDFGGFDKQCSREIFLERLSQTCPMNKKMKVYYFEEFRKEAGAFDRVCLSGGLNDMKRIISDVDASKAKNILIITDIFEAEEKFINQIEDRGGVIKGLDEPLYANQINDELKRVRSLCQ